MSDQTNQTRRGFMAGLFALSVATASGIGIDEAEAKSRRRRALTRAQRKAARPKRSGPPIHCICVSNDGLIVHEEHATVRREPASLVKMLTLLTVIEAMKENPAALPLKGMVRIPENTKKMRPDLYRIKSLRAGQEYQMQELMIACGSKSCAYSTQALAVHVGRLYSKDPKNEDACLDAFVKKMNVTADSIRMKDSRFTNPTGSPDPGNQYSTALDMVHLLKRLDDEYHPLSKKIMGQATFSLKGIRDHATHTLGSYVGDEEGHADFGKTGTTNRAGRCAAAKEYIAGKPHYLVVIGASSSGERAGVLRSMREEAKIAAKEPPEDFKMVVFKGTALDYMAQQAVHNAIERSNPAVAVVAP